MPWCGSCSRYLAPTALSEDGACQTCGAAVAPVDAKTLDLKQLADGDVSVPWHFKLLVGLLVAYLGWRLVALFV
jgi:hypothetical protein